MTEVDPVARPETAIIATQPVTLGSTHHTWGPTPDMETALTDTSRDVPRTLSTTTTHGGSAQPFEGYTTASGTEQTVAHMRAC